MSLIGMATAPWQLVALRLLAGLLGGYASGSTILVAAQTPKGQTGWALGVLSSGIMAGNVVGPLLARRRYLQHEARRLRREDRS